MAQLRTVRVVALAALLALLPLALLTYFSLRLAADAVENEVEARLSSTASLSGRVVREELDTLAALTESYAARPTVIRALAREPYDRDQLRFHLADLEAARVVALAFLARMDGTLIDIVPATPSIVGKNFAFRDWYRGLRRTGRTYVSEAYVTQATGGGRVVAAATYIRSGGRPIAIMVAAYDLEHLHRFSNELARAQGVTLKVTDQRGVLVAAPGRLPRGLTSRRSDPRVAAALAGRSGILELDTRDGRRLSAYAPIPKVGWTVTASVPSNAAFAAVGDLRSTVLAIAALLAAILLGGIALLARTLRQRRRAEENAHRSAVITQAVLDATTDGIALVDTTGCVTRTNGTFAAYVGDILGRRIDFEAEQRFAEVASEIAGRTTNADAYREATAAIESDQDRVALDEYTIAETGRSFLRYTAPVDDPWGERVGRLLVLRDVTAERKAERLKADLMATVSHELRTPLTGILGFSELLVRQDVDAEKRERYLETIYAEAKRLTALINDFLDLQRIEAGGLPLALESFDVRQTLEHEVAVFSSHSESHPIRLDVPDEPVVVVGEPQRIAQVVANLLSNAIKYSPQGGPVEVKGEPHDGAVRISVRDHGVGIPPDQQPSVFEKFFRVDSSDTRRIGGTGLGLALSREIVEAHAGRIGFDSAPGEGSTFWFELPSGDGEERGRDRILVIEDEAATAALLAAHLGDAGYGVEVVATAEEGLARAKADLPAAVCLDIRLPGELSGWDLLEALKADSRTAAVPIIVCTAFNHRGRAAALGADFLTKPFSREQLLGAVTRLLPERRGDVVVVDDEASIRRMIVETLAHEGLKTREAADGVDALAEVEKRRPDAMVLDLMMPRLDGFAVLERLQQNPDTRLLPVVVLTARRLTPKERETLSGQAVALLEKGAYTPQELIRLVTQAVGARAPA